MANCEFPAGLGHVSGTLSKKTIRTPRGLITRRVIAQFRNDKQRIYIREDQPRRTRISAKEVAIRTNFALMAKEVARRIEAGDTRPRKLIWADVKAEYKKGGEPCK